MRMMHLAVAVFCLAAAIQGAQARSSEFTGIPKIVDGDTIQFGDVRLHLEGIDAPQTDQACFDKTGTRWKCGVAARDQLKSLAGSKSWACKIDRVDIFGRQLAKCQAGGRGRRPPDGGGRMGAGIDHRLGDLSPGRGCRPRFRRGTLGRRLYRAAGLAPA